MRLRHESQAWGLRQSTAQKALPMMQQKFVVLVECVRLWVINISPKNATTIKTPSSIKYLLLKCSVSIFHNSSVYKCRNCMYMFIDSSLQDLTTLCSYIMIYVGSSCSSSFAWWSGSAIARVKSGSGATRVMQFANYEYKAAAQNQQDTCVN